MPDAVRPLIVANWKMHPLSMRAAGALFKKVVRGARGVRGIDIVIAPPVPFLGALQRAAGSVSLGAQDMFWERSGAYTGEISPAMLKDFGVRSCIIGHSERRRFLGETDEMINRKIKAAVQSGITPILAIGETERESHEVVPPTIAEELTRGLHGIAPRRLLGMAVAYEPVWAIGTGHPDTPDNATRRAIYIRKILVKLLGARVAGTIRILYGGSVNAKNAATFFSRDIRGIDGLLVGGASLDPEGFTRILQSVAGHRRRSAPR